MVTYETPNQLVLPGFEHFFIPKKMPIFIDPSPQDDPPPQPPHIVIYVQVNWTHHHLSRTNIRVRVPHIVIYVQVNWTPPKKAA